MYKIFSLFSTVFLMFVFTGCGGSANLQEYRHTPPVAIAKKNISGKNIRTGQTVILDASESYDPENHPLTYKWFDTNNQLIGESKRITWTAPDQEGVYQFFLEVTDEEGLTDKTEISLTVITSDRFAAIQKLIQNSQNGISQDVTYICVGDSIRSRGEAFKGYYVFDTIENELDRYGVTSILLAHSGEKAAYFDLIPSEEFDAIERNYGNDGYPTDFDTAGWPKWTDLVSDRYVKNDGNTTIVDISLGINDLLYTDGETIERRAQRVKNNLKDAIQKIWEKKPYVHFMLTVPYRGYDDNASPNSAVNIRLEKEALALENAYISLSDELNIPIVDIPARFMSEDPEENPDWIHWYRHTIETNPPEEDTAHVHLKIEYQKDIANYILEKILPEN